MKRLCWLLGCVWLVSCETATYVSDENRQKYAPIDIEKFVIHSELGQPDLTVHFGFDKSNLTEREMEKLNAFSERIGQIEGDVIISGHTDLTGSAAYNDGLSYRRSLAIAEYLKKKEGQGVHHRFTLHALGKHHPLLNAVGSRANAENRRGYIFFKPA